MTESGYKASFASEGKVIEGDERQLLADFIPTQIKKPTKKEPLSDDTFVFVIAYNVMLNVTNDKDTPNSALKSCHKTVSKEPTEAEILQQRIRELEAQLAAQKTGGEKA